MGGTETPHCCVAARVAPWLALHYCNLPVAGELVARGPMQATARPKDTAEQCPQTP